MGPVPEFLVRQVWDGARESAFKQGLRQMLMLLVQGPRSENDWLGCYGFRLWNHLPADPIYQLQGFG